MNVAGLCGRLARPAATNDAGRPKNRKILQWRSELSPICRPSRQWQACSAEAKTSWPVEPCNGTRATQEHANGGSLKPSLNRIIVALVAAALAVTTPDVRKRRHIADQNGPRLSLQRNPKTHEQHRNKQGWEARDKVDEPATRTPGPTE